MRWLRVGSKGYCCGSLPVASSHSEPGVGFADDLALLCEAIDQMQTPITKLEIFCAWSGMRLAPSKRSLTGIVHGAVPHATRWATDWTIIEPLLGRITIHGQRVQLVKPDAPFTYLGVQFTLTLNWRHQFAAAETLICENGQRLIQSRLSPRQKLLCEEQTILTALKYAFCITPYTPGLMLHVHESSRQS